MARRLIPGLLLLAVVACAQQRVDPKNIYHRLICVVPFAGLGTEADPKRPQYAPAPSAISAASPAGVATATDGKAVGTPTPVAPAIIGYMHVASDDGKFAIVEYVARDMAAFQSILNDKSIKVFVKGKDSKDAIEKELRKYKKDFSLDKFGLVLL